MKQNNIGFQILSFLIILVILTGNFSFPPTVFAQILVNLVLLTEQARL